MQTLYAFAMLMDAERIERQVDRLRDIRRAKDNATGYHEPERLWREGEDALSALLRPVDVMPMEELLAAAREIDRRSKAGTPVPMELT